MRKYNEKNVEQYDYIRSGHMFERKIDKIIEKIKKIPESKTKISEFGCGTGYTSFKIAEEFKNISVESSDTNKSFINFANEKYKNKNLKFLKEDIKNFNLKNEYDIVVTVDVLHHLNDLNRSIYNIKNSLKKESYWIVIEHNSHNLYIFLSQLIMPNERIFFQNKTEKIFKKYFDILEKEYFLLIPSFIKRPNQKLKRIESLFEKCKFVGGSVIYVLKKRRGV